MRFSEGWRQEQLHKKPQATRQDAPENPGRRKVLERIIGGAVLVGAGSLLLKGKGKFSKESQGLAGAQREGVANTSLPKPAEKEGMNVRSSGSKEVHDEVREKEKGAQIEGGPLGAYTFLRHEWHPQSVDMGELAGNRFSALYATYLGIPDGSTVPEVLRTDFKANLATLWREKFGFDVPGRTEEQERAHRERFLERHKDLMDLAERLYRSYETKNTWRMSLGEYTLEIEGVIKESHEAFMGAMYSLRGNNNFSQPRRALIEKMANRMGADALIACSLTEIMPSANGETNTEMLDILLRHAGADFLDRIPSIHDMLPSFGPYQITPALFAPGGVGSFAEKMEQKLPKDFLPNSVEDVSGKEQHRIAYIIAIEHIVQLAGHFSTHETARVHDILNHTPIDILHKEVAAFMAASHHQPEEAYRAFVHFLSHSPPPSSPAVLANLLLAHIHDSDLRAYTHKAIANYSFLTEPGAIASVENAVA